MLASPQPTPSATKEAIDGKTKETDSKRPIESYQHRDKQPVNNTKTGGIESGGAVKIVDDRGIESLKVMEVER